MLWRYGLRDYGVVVLRAYEVWCNEFIVTGLYSLDDGVFGGYGGTLTRKGLSDSGFRFSDPKNI